MPAVQALTEEYLEDGAYRSQADYDDLTKLYRFQAFKRHCADQLLFSSSAGSTMVIFLDADNLKLINDSFGHGVGDGLIREIANRVKRSLPPRSILCRKGGDEFVAALRCDDRRHAERILKRLLLDLRGSSNVAGHEILVSCSIGASIAAAGTANLSEQCHDADIAMYWAKQSGRDQVRIYDEESCADIVVMQQLSIQFPEALAKGQLSVVFQPIYQLDVRSSRIVGAEVLLRWKHEHHGNVAAEKIVQLATKSGKKTELGAFVAKKACEAALTWPASTYVCVNSSPSDFLRIDFAEAILSIVSESGLKASRFRIEITESEVLEHNDVVRSNIKRFQENGVKIGVDDFGTGYSSMANIDGFPADFVKIDRSLVSGCDHRISSRIFIRAIKSVADKIGFDLIAEGIETIDEAAVVRGAGITGAQGFHFSKPLSQNQINVQMQKAGRAHMTEYLKFG